MVRAVVRLGADWATEVEATRQYGFAECDAIPPIPAEWIGPHNQTGFAIFFLLATDVLLPSTDQLVLESRLHTFVQFEGCQVATELSPGHLVVATRRCDRPHLF